jgi:hypothetical protein
MRNAGIAIFDLEKGSSFSPQTKLDHIPLKALHAD